MPELPEVETTKEGIKPHLTGQNILGVLVRQPKLRVPVNPDINRLCAGKTINKISRRAKYLLIELTQGHLLIHLGMSGHLRLVNSSHAIDKHDHIDVHLSNGLTLRYRDPRRFGMFLYIDGQPEEHSLLNRLGPEPLSNEFNSTYLIHQAQKKSTPIKSFIMNNQVVVGVGNIYATESLHLSGIHPNSPTNSVSPAHLTTLCGHIKETLQRAIDAGGTTLRDYYSSEGKPGYFSVSLRVYGRQNQPCFTCNQLIDSLHIAGRNSAFCPKCQPLFV